MEVRNNMATANIYDVSDCNSTHGYETTIDWIEDTQDRKSVV